MLHQFSIVFCLNTKTQNKVLFVYMDSSLQKLVQIDSLLQMNILKSLYQNLEFQSINVLKTKFSHNISVCISPKLHKQNCLAKVTDSL